MNKNPTLVTGSHLDPRAEAYRTNKGPTLVARSDPLPRAEAYCRNKSPTLLARRDPLPRAEAVAAVSVALKAFLSRAHDANEVSGVIGIGGSGGTSLIAAALKELPIGTPKMIVSTVGLCEAH